VSRNQALYKSSQLLLLLLRDLATNSADGVNAPPTLKQRQEQWAMLHQVVGVYFILFILAMHAIGYGKAVGVLAVEV